VQKHEETTNIYDEPLEEGVDEANANHPDTNSGNFWG
jgi:hypothetical protein